MKSIKRNWLAALCAAMLTLSLTACEGGLTSQPTSGTQQPAHSENAPSQLPSSMQASLPESFYIGNYPARQLDAPDGVGVYYIEIYTPDNDLGNHPSALDCAETLGAALLKSGVPNIAEERHIYLAFTGLDIVNGAKVYAFAVSLGSEFDMQSYASLGYFSVDYSGNIYSMPGVAGVWERWIPSVEIDTGVFYLEGTAQQSDPGENPSALDSAKTAWDAMKKHGAPTGAPGRNIIFRLTGVETFNGADLYVYSVELDYDDGPEPLFRVGLNYDGDVVCDAGGEGWEPLPYGNMFGGQLAVLPEDAPDLS